MPLFYRWRDRDPDKPRGDFQVSWHSWGRAVAGSLVSTLGAAPAAPRASGAASRWQPWPCRPACLGAGFPPSSRPAPSCSSLALILPDFSLARPFLFVQHCALCPILSLPLPHTAVFFRLSGAWESVQEAVFHFLAVLCSPGPSALRSSAWAEGPETPLEFPFPSHLGAATTQSL